MNNPLVINSFTQENAFLSNFWECEICWQNRKYKSVEAAYQTAKSHDSKDWDRFQFYSPSMAKKFGKLLNMRPDWDSVKFSIMSDLVFQKFTKHPELRDKLIATAPKVLIEGNWWHDTYWGICNGKGENNLGKILMSVREFCIQEYGMASSI